VTWELKIPFRSRSDSLGAVFEAARVLPADEDRAVARQLVLGEIAGGSATTAGELIDQLEKASPEQRRKMLDDARVAVGLEDTGTVEFNERFAAANAGARARAGADRREARFGYNETGGIVDLNERDDAVARAEVEERSRRHAREERETGRAAAAAEHTAHDHARAASLGEASRDQFPQGFR
jgi:hypothetical protein